MRSGNTQVLLTAFENRLEEQILDELRLTAKRRSYPPRSVLCRQGEIEHVFYIVVEGRIAVARTFEDGEEQLMGIMGPGDYFGEMSLLDNRPRMATCTAMTDTTVLEVDEEVFETLVEKSPVLAQSLTHRILTNLRHLDQQTIKELVAKNQELNRAYDDLKTAQAQIVEKERLEKELELAANVQRQLLPAMLPDDSRYHFAAYLRPARSVGGDFYDVIKLDAEHIGILLADVADKGLHASLFMAMTRTLFYSEGRRSLSPAATALAVHQGMFDVATNLDTFVTAFYGVLHRPTGRLTYVRAAQEKPFLIRPGKPVRTLPGEGRFLGMVPDLELTESAVQLRPEDRLLLFSDGLSDAESESGQQYGYERLRALLDRQRQNSAAELVDAVVADVHRFMEHASPFDDMTLLAIEVRDR